MAINVISDAPHIPRCILRIAVDLAPVPTPSVSHPQPQSVVTTAVTSENWDIVHWPQFRYEIVDSLTPLSLIHI